MLLTRTGCAKPGISSAKPSSAAAPATFSFNFAVQRAAEEGAGAAQPDQAAQDDPAAAPSQVLLTPLQHVYGLGSHTSDPALLTHGSHMTQLHVSSLAGGRRGA